MDLRKRYRSYRWRLFLPILALVWLTAISLMIYSYHHESELRQESINKQLSLFNSRVLYAHANHLDIQDFLNSLKYFFEDSRFDNVQISVYTKEDYQRGMSPTYSIGAPIDREFIRAQSSVDADSIAGTSHYTGPAMFFYKGTRSNEGDLYVFTAIPNSIALTKLLKASDASFWIILGLILLATLVLTYFLTNSLSKNVRMLQKFARNSNDENFEFDESQFPHDELGDISRQIVKICRERGEALERSRREHDIAIHAVEEKSRIKRQLTNNINHELKTPVGVIKGYLDTVLSSPEMDDKTRDYFLKRAQENVDRLCNLLGDVSTMTRLEEGSTNIPLQNIDFHDTVFAIENDFQTSGMNGSMKFEYDIPLDCQIKANNMLLTSAITNLMKNAVLHSHGTAMGIRIVAESQKYYTFSFWDNGQGVGQEHLPHLFDRFYRVDAGRSRKSGGTGLGLPIVKNIIETLGGSISVHTRSTGGLEFLFTLKKAE